jgi:hypothetical protein
VEGDFFVYLGGIMQERSAIGIRGQGHVYIAIAVGVEEGLPKNMGFFGGEVAGEAIQDFSQGGVAGSVPSEDKLAWRCWGGCGFALFLLYPKRKRRIKIAVLPDFLLKSGEGKRRTVRPREQGSGN